MRRVEPWCGRKKRTHADCHKDNRREQIDFENITNIKMNDPYVGP